MRLPVNNDDLTTMYEGLIEILSKHGESGDVLSWVGTLYSKAKFGQPSEKKALSVDSIKALLTTIMKKELVDIGEHFCFVCGEPMSEEKRGLLINHIAQAIHSSLPAQREVRYLEKIKHEETCPLSFGNLCDCKLLSWQSVCPEHGNYGCTCGASKVNHAIDLMKKLNGDKI